MNECDVALLENATHAPLLVMFWVGGDLYVAFFTPPGAPGVLYDKVVLLCFYIVAIANNQYRVILLWLAFFVDDAFTVHRELKGVSVQDSTHRTYVEGILHALSTA